MIPEINLKLETKKIPSDNNLTLEQMKEMFGWRIRRALIQENKNKHIYGGLSHKKMLRLCKKWKFWNNDIRKAYKRYVGYMYMPYVITYGIPIVLGGDFVPSKSIKSRYSLAVNDL